MPIAALIDDRYPRITRHVDGYNLDLILAQIRASTPLRYEQVNLAHLLCGSEGTLGVTVGAELALVDAPRARGLGIVAFPDIDAALEAVLPILETRPAAVELIDRMIIDLARRNTEYARYVSLLPRQGGEVPGAVLYVEYQGDDAADVQRLLASLVERFGDGDIVDVQFMKHLPQPRRVLSTDVGHEKTRAALFGGFLKIGQNPCGGLLDN